MRACAIVVIFFGVASASGQAQSGETLVQTLRNGGFVIVMTPPPVFSGPPAVDGGGADTRAGGTQAPSINQSGRVAIIAMGNAVRRLMIPVGEVLSTPARRAIEVAQLARFSRGVKAIPQLSDVGQSSAGVATGAHASFLKMNVTEVPTAGNRIVITHMPNVVRAFPQAADLVDGEALVFRPDGSGGAALVWRIKLDQWPQLTN